MKILLQHNDTKNHIAEYNTNFVPSVGDMIATTADKVYVVLTRITSVTIPNNIVLLVKEL